MATACQPQSKPTATAPPVVAASHKAAAPAAGAPVNEHSLEFVSRYNLTPLLQEDADNSVLHLNGFYGPDNYRMELALLSVRHDPAQPGRYLVTGKDRYKKIITPLTGYIDFTDAGSCPVMMFRESDSPACTVQGRYELREDSTTHGAGIFRGRIAADISISATNEVQLHSNGTNSPSRGGMLTLTGNWTSLATGQQKAATWVYDLEGYHGPQVASDFIIGERGEEINFKYAKFGWNNVWENDEWWADSPKPSLNL